MADKLKAENTESSTDGGEFITKTDTGTLPNRKFNLDVMVNNDSTNPVPATLANAELETPTIYNLTSPVPVSTEFSQALSAGTKEFTIRARGAGNLQFSFTVGTSGTNFIEVPNGTSFTQERALLTGKTLYMQVDTSAESVEILEWT